MKTIISKSKLLLSTAGLLAILTLHSTAAEIEDLEYRFTGTVEATDPDIGFRSPDPTFRWRFPTPFQARVGDQVTGRLRFPVPFPWTGTEGYFPGQNRYRSRIEKKNHMVLEVEINGHRLSPLDLVFATVGNNVNRQQGISTGFFATSLPLVKRGRADTFHIGYPEVSVDGTPSDGRLEVHLNFTDSSRQAFESRAFPPSIDLQMFDIAKGFIISHGVDGIMFNIDTLEEVDPNAPAPSIELSTGSHVSWPSDAESEGYILEEAESPAGPWTPSESAPIVVDGRNIVVMDQQSAMKFYRLVKAN